MNKANGLYVGIDFGSESVRCIVLDRCGNEKGHGSAVYPRFKDGKYCDGTIAMYRQHPLDHFEALDAAMLEALADCDRSLIRGIGVDTTGSTPCLADSFGRPLALQERFAENPDAMFVLWKDHTAEAEAVAITQAANENAVKYTGYCGTVYSSEWFWAKMLHVLRSSPELSDSTYTFVEHCDYIVHELCGNTDVKSWKRSQCAAGHKAMFHPSWGGLPPEEFFRKCGKEVVPYWQNLYNQTFVAGSFAGYLAEKYCRKWDLPSTVAVSVGALDGHLGAVGAGIEYGTFVKIMGTSCSDMVLASDNIGMVPGICGQAAGSVLPGMTTLEEGQGAFGDVYAWFKRLFDYNGGVGWEQLEKDASAVAPALENPWALDWLNGRRTPFADGSMRGMIGNINLGTSVPMLYRAMVESTIFGSRRIVEHVQKYGVEIEKIIASGGISLKSDFVMQMLADVMNMDISVAASTECCACGAAIMAAAAAGDFPDVLSAKRAMQSKIGKTYIPDRQNVGIYNALYHRYLERCRLEEEK